MKEAAVEGRLQRLASYGFKVLKLTTPGHNGTPDRLILRPTWSPGPPWVVEVKRPGKHERRLQELVRDDWRARGVLVLDAVSTFEEVDALVVELMTICNAQRQPPTFMGMELHYDPDIPPDTLVIVPPRKP